MVERTAAAERFDPWIGIVFAALFILTVVAFAGLLPYGHWQPDEFQNLVSWRRDPAHFFWARLTTWSPRPISELLVYSYLGAVDTFHRPLIGEALAGHGRSCSDAWWFPYLRDGVEAEGGCHTRCYCRLP
jgi:hypothetical protein